jgi:DNA-binding CsgD family transcriptional regulator
MGQAAELADLGLRAVTSRELKPLFDEAAALVARALDVEFVSVVEVVPDSKELIIRAFPATPHRFSESDLAFMRAVANLLAAAVERRVLDERLERARDLERRRIARYLHNVALREVTEALALAQAPTAGRETPTSMIPALERIGEQLRSAIYDLQLNKREDHPLRDPLEGIRASASDGRLILEIADDGSGFDYAGMDGHFGDRDRAAQITAREREVLQGLAEGLDSQSIADRLHISARTERNHVANILAKLGVHSRLQALVAAVRLGLVSIR